MWENKCFLQKQRTNLKADLRRKYHPPPWKPAEHGWTAPAHSSFSFQSSSSAPEGARTQAHFKHRSISQWNLNKVKWRTLCKKGCRQFHPSNTSSKQQRNSREAQSLSLFSPSPHFLVFYFPTICNRKMLILFILFFFFFQEFGKVTYEENSLCGEGCLILSKIVLFDKCHKVDHPVHRFLLLLAEFRSADGLPSLSNRITFHLIEILYIYTCMYSVNKVSSHETKLRHYVFFEVQDPKLTILWRAVL